MSELDDIVKDFLVESYENLDQLDRDFVVLEQDPTDREILARIFRTIHTIKGTCGFLGFAKLEAVAHGGESLLGRLRDGELRLNPEITSALLAMVDAVRQILASIEATAQDGDNPYTDLVAILTRLQRSDRIPQVPVRKQSAREVHQAETPPAAATPPESTSHPPVAATVGEAEAYGTNLLVGHIGEILVKQGYARPEDVAQVLQQQSGDPRYLGEILVEQGSVKPQDLQEALRIQAESRPQGVSDSTIRVDVRLLDKLMNLVGELVLARNQILQFAANQRDTAFTATSQRLNLITTELQEGVMKTRMQPIGNVWSKFPRVVRDLAVSCGKLVRVEMNGKETELDKTIIEAIKDPLTHLVRNSVDHGIESPEVRLAAGKPAEGWLSLQAFHEGGQVNIEIADDGAGINLERVKQKAVQQALITPEQATRISDREAVTLIFLPGFSTAEKITTVSGRGVGMDVVKTNIEKIGGTVDVQSKMGHGTTYKIKIPLTLAIIPALTVTSGGDRYAIPQESLLELVRLKRDQAANRIERIHSMPVCRLRGNLLPLVYLNHELGVEGAATDDGAVSIVVLQADGRQFGLVVDEINDTQEIMVKPLGKQLKSVSIFAGATIMSDGKVALILDVLGIAQHV